MSQSNGSTQSIYCVSKVWVSQFFIYLIKCDFWIFLNDFLFTCFGKEKFTRIAGTHEHFWVVLEALALVAGAVFI